LLVLHPGSNNPPLTIRTANEKTRLMVLLLQIQHLLNHVEYDRHLSDVLSRGHRHFSIDNPLIIL
jgi:hypothetical protein